jgi:SAM-dependent methyltransferase
MELLLGCGNNLEKKVTFPAIPAQWTELVTLDVDPSVKPQVVHDLANVPYTMFGDDVFDEIHAYEVLEHCGRQGDWRLYFDQFSEFWRILKPGGYLIATVPLWDSKWAWGDPGHTRIINEGSLIFLSQEEYKRQVGKTSMSDYRGWYKADFEVISIKEDKDTFGFVLEAVKPARL